MAQTGQTQGFQTFDGCARSPDGLKRNDMTMVADYLTLVHRNPKRMPKGLAYEMNENLIYFRFYSTSASLTVYSLTNKSIVTLNARDHVGPHNIFQHKNPKPKRPPNARWKMEKQKRRKLPTVQCWNFDPRRPNKRFRKASRDNVANAKPGVFGRNIYFAHIDQSHYYDKNCEEVLKEAASASGCDVPPMCRN